MNDKEKIHAIISDMTTCDEFKLNGYPTPMGLSRFETYLQQVRMEALGWMHAECCIILDNGGDPRTVDIPDILSRAFKDLSDLSE
jgi:hypothetical protein